MSNLLFDAKLKEAMKMEGDLPSAPVPRYKQRAVDCGISSLSLSNESSFLDNTNFLNVTDTSMVKTPRTGSILDRHHLISPGRNKSPGRSMPKLAVRSHKSPGRHTPKSGCNPADRFIPSRSTTDMERAHHLLINGNDQDKSTSSEDFASIKQKEYTEKMLQNLNDGAPTEDRILSFKAKAPASKDSHVNNLKMLYSASKSSVSKNPTTRRIPSVPEKILDAPDLLDDYYLHNIDWSVNNHLAVALGNSIFIWNAADGSIVSLTQFEDPDYVCSVSWIKEGNVLAVGLSNSTTQLWDVGQQKLIRTMGGQDSRITTLSWNDYILSCGSRSGQITHNDVRTANHVTDTLSTHTQEVCGLKWSNDKRALASGGNDNLLCIYDGRSTTPVHTLNAHQAAVKGLAWCPWQSNLLASGGGTADRTIKIWNCSAGNCLKSLDTGSQVSSILWSNDYRELISGHGFSQYQLTIWKYPNFTKVADLLGHSGRVLELCLSPDGQTVVSAAADETLRLWKCWAIEKKSLTKQASKNLTSALARTIR